MLVSPFFVTWNPFKHDEQYFLFHLKNYFCSEDLNFCSNFFGYIGKQLDKRASVSLKIYDVTTWKKNNDNKPNISMRQCYPISQWDNEIWSANRI